jgi:hypothetical protein
MIYDTPGKTFKGMADAIRTLEGSSAPIPVIEMPDRIRALQPTPLSIDISGKTSKNWVEALIPYIYILRGNSGMSVILNGMFSNYCAYQIRSTSGLPDIDLSSLYLPPSVKSLAGMFRNSRINSIDFDTWDTRYIHSMYDMFSNCAFNKVWLPKSFTNQNLANPPFLNVYNTNNFDFDIYTDSTEDRTQEWGINPVITVHYNSTHQDFLNA